VGPSGQIWFSSNLNVAKTYAKSKSPGAVVELEVDSWVVLEDKGNSVYTAPVRHAVAGTYYRVAGVRPKRILDADDGSQIAL
jgi:hypothetical protein